MEMQSAQQVVDVPQVEAVIRRLLGVVSARVQADSHGGIAEVHVVVDESRSPKQTSRDVESALLSELGLRIDHRKISVAQMRGEALQPTQTRLKFLSADLHMGRAGMEIKVGLGQDSDSFQGVAHSSEGEPRQLHLVAQATLQAVEEFLRLNLEREPPTLEVEEVSTIQHGGGPEAVLVLVRLRDAGREERLLGSALVKADRWRTAAWATLDAINRRLARLAA